jgi:hypothetical protein
MKRLLVLLGLLALPLFAAATENTEVLLTSAGNLFSVASEAPVEGSTSEATMHLVLTERRDDQIVREIVPATMERGKHTNPLLGYDDESGTLFVFWIKHVGAIYNQLFFVTRDSAGNWSVPTEFGNPYNVRENLRVAMTRKVTGANEESSAAGLSIHATWWEFDTRTRRESAQYHMLSIENGRVDAVTELDLNQFIDHKVFGVANFEASAMKYPLIVSSSKQDSVLLTFGSTDTGSFTQVRVTPKFKGEARLRVPGGKRVGGFGAPRMAVNAGSSLEGVFSESSDTLALYTAVEGAVRYAILNNGQWSEIRSIVLDEHVSSAVAVSALRKMVAEQ